MIKKINVVGIQLDNYTVREMIMNVERMLGDNIFECIQEVDMDILSLAAEDEQVKELLDSLTYTIISDVGILRAAGVETMQRKHEIEEHVFFYELMKRIERNHKTVFLLADNVQNIEWFKDKAAKEFPKIKIVGEIAADDAIGDEAVVNEINAETPDVIISTMSSPAQEHFLCENKDKLSANLWYGMGNARFGKKSKNLWSRLRKIIKINRLAKNINEYKEQEEK